MFYGIAKGMDELTSKGVSLTVVLGTLGYFILKKLGLFTRLRASFIANSLAGAGMHLRILALIKVFSSFILRLGAVGFALWAVYKIAQAFNARMAGEVSWLDVWEAYFVLGFTLIELFFKKIQLRMGTFGLWVRSFWDKNPLLTKLIADNKVVISGELGDIDADDISSQRTDRSPLIYRPPSPPPVNNPIADQKGIVRFDVFTNGLRTQSDVINDGDSKSLVLGIP